jgi:ABC-type nitrate/sulfonate/bicarbonate transport system substrate-binding protein
LAKEAGILKKHNLELEIILITGGPVAMQALLAKSLDIITTSATVFLHGFVEGADVKIIGGVNNRFPYTFFSRPNITTPPQLKGKVIGITRYGSTDEFATRMALEQFGLNAKTDVKFIQGGGSAGRINALLAGPPGVSSRRLRTWADGKLGVCVDVVRASGESPWKAATAGGS